ncbi:MAG: hypothetical protein LUG86_01415 [Oscillospiraceae bacterium]|nr:hypothetical protein [Oscillospiraceae bacterium]
MYRLLGVNRFQRLVLTIERIKHHRVGGHNENYHPDGMSIFSLERFRSFLVYNAFLHSVSLLFAISGLILSAFLGHYRVALCVFSVLLLVANLYCIMLQRTNFLRLRKRFNRCYKRVLSNQDVLDKEAMRKLYLSNPEKLRQDFEVIERIKRALDSESDCFLTDADTESLRRISGFVSIKPAAAGHRKEASTEILDQCAAARPYTVLQKRADSVQRLLRIPGRTALDHPAIITENRECEEFYRRIIPSDSPDCLLTIRFTLAEAYSKLLEEIE